MTYAQKLRLARQLPRSAEDRQYNRKGFHTEAWGRRADAIALRVKKQQGAAHERAEIRKGNKKEGFFAKRARVKQEAARRAIVERKARHAKYLAKLKATV